MKARKVALYFLMKRCSDRTGRSEIASYFGIASYATDDRLAEIATNKKLGDRIEKITATIMQRQTRLLPALDPHAS